MIRKKRGTYGPSQSFEDFLKDKFMEEEPAILDDDLPDAFDHWTSNLDVDEAMKFAEEWAEFCPDCLGSGEVSTMERVYANEPHMADIGVAPCPNPIHPWNKEKDHGE